MAGPRFKKFRKALESDRSKSTGRSLSQSIEEIHDRNRISTDSNPSRLVSRQPLSGSTSRHSCGSASSIRNRDSTAHETSDDGIANHANGSDTDNEEDGQDESSVEKLVRGVSRCLALDKHVEKFGKIKLIFNIGKREPSEHSVWFSDAIGYTIRTSAELENVSRWKNIPETNKEVCRARLLTWFDIEEWESDRIQSMINYRLQSSYRQWRNHLKECYDSLKAKKLDPKKKSPRPEVTLEKWLSVCDWIESENFQKRSSTNKRNRENMKSIHTSGRISYQTHYERMPQNEQSKIELYKKTHTDKHGNFVDPKDEVDYNKMVELKEASLVEGAVPKSDDQILVEVLGIRSGYQKGIGYGVVPPQVSKILSGAQQAFGLTEKLNEAQSKLEVTQNALENAQGEINILSKKLEEEKGKNDSKFEALQRQIEQMQQAYARQ